MHVRISADKNELETLLRSLVPLRVDLSSEAEGRRIIEIKSMQTMQMIPARGVRIRCAASVEWPVLGVALPVDIAPLEIDLSMSLVASDDAALLTWNFAIEDADIKLVPGFVEKPVIARVNEALSSDAATLKWAVGEALAKSFPLPAMLQPLRAYVTRLGSPALEITAEGVVLSAEIRSAIG